jgi:hypothetical protein
MIHVTAPPEPAAFHNDCRVPGNAWLAANPDPADRLPDHWRHFIPDLCAAFLNRCGYLAMWDLNGTVDHYLGTDTHRHLAYEWSNYRYASGWINSSKQTLDRRVLDPFRVRDGWFEIDLPSLHLRLTAAVPPRFRPRAEFTLRRLKLDWGARVIDQRQIYYDLFRTGGVGLGDLERQAPLLADAVRRTWLLDHLAANPPVSRSEAAMICQATPARITLLLQVWRRAGHLVATGHGPGVRYQLP